MPKAAPVENLAEVDSEPNGWLIPRGPGDPVAAVCGKQHVVASTEFALALAVDPQPCRAAEQQNPLVMVLVIGRIHGRCLAVDTIRSIRAPFRDRSSVNSSFSD